MADVDPPIREVQDEAVQYLELPAVELPGKQGVAKGKPIKKSIKRFLPSLRGLSFYKADRSLKLIVSISIRLSIIVGLTLISLYLYRELNDDSYHIQAFEVPDNLESMGYDGKVVAHQLQDELQTIAKLAVLMWSPKAIEEYNQSGDNAQIQAEVAGIGFSPETAIRYFKQVLGIPYRSISGEILQEDKRLRLVVRGVRGLNIGGLESRFVLEEPVVESEVKALDLLIKKAAIQIVKQNNPLLLALVYQRNMSAGSDLPMNDTLSVDMLRSAISKPAQAADANAWWARILILNDDSVAAMTKIRRALQLDPDNASAYRFWGAIKFENGDFEGGEKLLLKSLSLDPDNPSAWSALGQRYFNRNGKNDREAEKCFRNASSMDPFNQYSFNLWLTLCAEGKYEESIAQRERVFVFVNYMATEIASMEIAGDSVGAEMMFNREKRINRRTLSNSLSQHAAWLKGRRTIEKQAFHYAELAIRADSSNVSAYQVLTELYGFQGDQPKFYSNLEKALKLGLNVREINEKEEPYNQFTGQLQYEELKSKFRKKPVFSPKESYYPGNK